MSGCLSLCLEVLESVASRRFNSLFILQTTDRIAGLLNAEATIDFVESVVQSFVPGIEIILSCRTPPAGVGAKKECVWAGDVEFVHKENYTIDTLTISNSFDIMINRNVGAKAIRN